MVCQSIFSLAQRGGNALRWTAMSTLFEDQAAFAEIKPDPGPGDQTGWQLNAGHMLEVSRYGQAADVFTRMKSRQQPPTIPLPKSCQSLGRVEHPVIFHVVGPPGSHKPSRQAVRDRQHQQRTRSGHDQSIQRCQMDRRLRFMLEQILVDDQVE